MSLKNSEFLKILGEKQILEATPSFHMIAYSGASKLLDLKLGEDYEYYDIASLTKIVFTVTRLMEMKQNSELDIHSKLSKYTSNPKDEAISVFQLLTHSAGHRWWAPLYESLLEDPAGLVDFSEQWEKLLELLQNEVREPEPEKYVYSDIDFMFLGEVIKKISGNSLLKDFESFRSRWGMNNTFYSVNNLCPVDVNKIAPTEFSAWRTTTMQGQVHDENTYSLGGVSSHAGLFSKISDLESWCLKIRSSYLGKGILNEEVVKEFSKSQVDPKYGDWGLGFMKPTYGSASCGKLFSAESFGHTGFTGTSIWFDMENDIFAIVLSNRVNPSRENKKFVPLRAKIHDAIFKVLKGSTDE